MQILAAFLSLLLLAAPASAIEIIAHRGASQDAPENTLAAMQLAWEQGADAIEIDLHLSQDGRIVVMHDPDTERTTGVPGAIVEQSWAALTKLDAGRWKDPRFAGERVPTLESILGTVGAGQRIFIEIKCGAEILPGLQRVLASSKLPPERLVIIGFNLETVTSAKTIFPDLKVFWLHTWKKNAPVEIEELVGKARAAKLDGLNLHQGFPVSREFVRSVKDAGLALYVWTIDDPAVARRWIEAGVDGVTTNRPRWLRKQLIEVSAIVLRSECRTSFHWRASAEEQA